MSIDKQSDHTPYFRSAKNAPKLFSSQSDQSEWDGMLSIRTNTDSVVNRDVIFSGAPWPFPERKSHSLCPCTPSFLLSLSLFLSLISSRTPVIPEDRSHNCVLVSHGRSGHIKSTLFVSHRTQQTGCCIQILFHFPFYSLLIICMFFFLTLTMNTAMS